MSTAETALAELGYLKQKVANAESYVFDLIVEEMDGQSPDNLLQQIRELPLEEDDTTWFGIYAQDILGHATKKDLEAGGYSGEVVEESFHDFLSKHQARFIEEGGWAYDVVYIYANELVEKIWNGSGESSFVMMDYLYARHDLWLATREEEQELVKAARD